MTHDAPTPTPTQTTAPTNAQLTDAYFDVVASLGNDVASRRAARAYMDRSSAIVHHRHVASSFVPKLYGPASYAAMKRTCETTHRILVKVIERYLADPAYRAIFDYDPRLVELILMPRPYPDVLPFARFDVFLDEDDQSCRFCEFNADGSSGMNENREIGNSIFASASFETFLREGGHVLHDCELFESWAREFLRIYRSCPQAVEAPRVAICDYLENAVVAEFEIFCEVFRSLGVEAVVADVRELEHRDGALFDAQGRRIDAIWRRSVTNDVIEHWDRSQDLVGAVREGHVVLIGSFAGHIVHDKQIFEALFHPLTREMLTDEENAFLEATVPLTRHLDSREVDLEQIVAERAKWIVKPTDAYGAADVYAGELYDEGEWREIVERYADGRAGAPFLVQSYITPFKTRIMKPDLDIAELADDQVGLDDAPYNNLEGLYCYNGRFAGVFSRLGPYATISKPMAGITAATVWVDCPIDEPDLASGAWKTRVGNPRVEMPEGR